MEMLEAREARARRQRELLDCLSCPVVSFTMNIPGPVKNGPVIRRAFREGLLRLDAALDAPGLGVVSREEIDLPTGCEALWAVRGPGRQIKELCAAIEDRDPLGRQFDLDVLDPEQGGPGAVSPALPGLRQGGKRLRLPAAPLGGGAPGEDP